jgi:hypothetical protein
MSGSRVAELGKLAFYQPIYPVLDSPSRHDISAKENEEVPNGLFNVRCDGVDGRDQGNLDESFRDVVMSPDR